MTEHTTTRLDKLESDVSTVTKAITDITRGVATITANQNHMNNTIETVLARQERQSNQKPQWQTLLALITLIVMIFGGIVSAFYFFSVQPIKDELSLIKTNQQTNTDELIRRAEFMGRQKALAEIDREQIRIINEQVHIMQRNRFTDVDGDKLRVELQDYVDKKVDK